MKLFQNDTKHRRMLGAVFTITFVVSVLLTAFFQTQVLTGSQYMAQAEENRLRPIPIPAPRGTILDRHGAVVATSLTGYAVSVLPGDPQLIRRTLVDLMPFLGLSAADVERLAADREKRPNDILEVTVRATYSQAAAIEERRQAFPNVMVVERPQRYYPAGAAIGHLIGYVTEITAEQLRVEPYVTEGYRQGRLIGQAGIEKEYELSLSGEDGARFVEVDARGRVVDPRVTVGALPPQSGQPLRLTLDLELQKYLHEIFPDTMLGAVVAMTPSTGEILALYSNPGFDPNAFVGRIPPQLWTALNTDPRKPLLNRAILALYPPASTWKTATAVVAVQRGIANAGTVMPISCGGGMFYAGRYARCWYSAGHGRLNLAQAIEKSCNVYFYQLGIRLGLDELTAAGTRIGFGQPTGIDLPEEARPIFPTGLPWYERRFGHRPTPSEVMSLAIGQGPNSQTVLNMAQFYAAIAGNGTGVVPHLVDNDETRNRPPTIDLGLDAAGLEAVWQGLQLVTERGGTAVLSSLARYKLYGKTGTAQNPHGPDHAWFTGFAGRPGGPPEIVVAVLIEEGLHGSDAAPIAAKAANFYLDRKYGHPFDPQPTLAERLRRGGAWDPEGRTLVPATVTRPAGGGGARDTARREG